MSSYRQQILDVVSQPEIILRDKSEALKAVGIAQKTHLGTKYLVVVYREGETGKGEIIWKKV
jgi:hypothetical protein